MSSKTKREKSSDARLYYIGLICAVAVVQLVLKVFSTFVPDAPSQVLSRINEGGMLLFALFFAWRTTFVQPWLGLRVEKANAKRTVLCCILLTLGIVLAFVAARLVMQQISPAVAARPFFRTYLEIKHRRYYLFFVLLQEILAKGILQYGMEKTLPADKWGVALLLSALVFGMVHVLHTLYYMLGAICLAFASGILYHRQKNIWSSVLLHFLIAFLPRCFGLK